MCNVRVTEKANVVFQVVVDSSLLRTLLKKPKGLHYQYSLDFFLDIPLTSLYLTVLSLYTEVLSSKITVSYKT